MVWEEMTGAGNLAVFTCISIGLSFMIARGYNRNNPCCSEVVEMEEGGCVDARVEGADCSKSDSIEIGTPLKVKYLHRQEGDLSGVRTCFRMKGFTGDF